MSFRLFNYPQQAIFRKVLPKSKIYEFAKPSNAVKELFIKQVEQIVWEYKLSPETINIPAGDGVQEVQILQIQSKVPEISEQVFRAIDEAIPSHIFYEVELGNKVKLVAAYKRQSEADTGKWVTGSYFESDWIAKLSDREDIPIAINMGGLYAQMLRGFMPEKARVNETLKAQSERLELLRIKTADITKLEIKLSKEKQFNRRVELNSRLRFMREELKHLTN